LSVSGFRLCVTGLSQIAEGDARGDDRVTISCSFASPTNRLKTCENFVIGRRGDGGDAPSPNPSKPLDDKIPPDLDCDFGRFFAEGETLRHSSGRIRPSQSPHEREAAA
jgi:hypothetical protein